MVSNISNSVASGPWFLSNFLNTVQIYKLLLPEFVQSGSNIVLDCQYTVPDSQFTLLWLFGNGNKTQQIYKWIPSNAPEISEDFQDNLDYSFKISQNPKEEYRALRILQAGAHLSGDYTCAIVHNGVRSSQTKNMIIYNSEEDFDLVSKENMSEKSIEISCSARGLYPHPDMTLEYGGVSFVHQTQRVWRASKFRYNIETYASLLMTDENNQQIKCKHLPLGITCRVHLPQVHYTAIKKRYLRKGIICNRSELNSQISMSMMIILILAFAIWS